MTRFDDSGDDLWHQFLKSVQPLKKRTALPFQSSQASFVLRRPKTPFQHKDGFFTVPNEPPHLNPDALDARVEGRLKGKRPVIDARLDLHGDNLKQAFEALHGFIHRSLAYHHKMVLVITGKSLRASTKTTANPRLVDIVPVWLRTPPFNQYVGKIVQARPQDGGSGALYVYLRHS